HGCHEVASVLTENDACKPGADPEFYGFYFARTLETARGYTTRIKEKAGKLPTEKCGFIRRVYVPETSVVVTVPNLDKKENPQVIDQIRHARRGHPNAIVFGRASRDEDAGWEGIIPQEMMKLVNLKPIEDETKEAEAVLWAPTIRTWDGQPDQWPRLQS
ncbi:unnamed protein product, partial [Symbiodinium pilosum]